MVDMAYLKSKGASSGAYKKLFTMDPASRPPKLNQLIELIAERIRRGRENNLRDYRCYAAIDLAYEAPFNQTTPTIIQSIVSKRLSPEKTLELLKSWGLSEEDLFLTIEVDGKKARIPNPPVFFNVLIPLVKAYTTIRGAKLYTDRDKNPLLEFAPLKPIAHDRVVCEIVTDMVQTLTTWYGYSSVLRSAIMQMLKYGVALSFPREEWHCDEQVNFDGVKTEVVTVKEGLRYVFPHPTRMFYDLQYPLTTINTDSGTEYAGHWSVCRYGDILDNRMYWNRRQVTWGTNWFEGSLASNYFSEVYPCTMRFPALVGAAPETREERSAFYTANDRDAAVFLTEYFVKLVPLKWGMADYSYPVWHRFTVAADDVIIWCEPCAYNPCWMMGYDYDDQSPRQSSFALECIPWQDHLGNILAQMILTTKQNLANIIYYDTNVVNKSDVDKILNLGEQKFRSMNFLPFDGLKAARQQVNPANAFQPIQFQFRDVSQLAQSMSWALNIMERVLQMSAQEVGATAQHYQSAKEIAVTQNATTNRIAHTGSYVDDGVHAWKQQLYAAAQAYLDASVLAEVDEDIPELDSVLEELGFKVVGKGKDKVVVKGRKTGLRVEGFARDDTQTKREIDMALAQVMYQTVQALSTNPELFNVVGPKNILSLLEQAAQLSGAPREFKLRMDPKATPGGVMAKVTEMMQQLQQGMVQFVTEKVAQPAAQQAAKQEQQLTAMEQAMQQLMGIYKVAQAQVDKNQAIVADAQQKMQIRQAEFEAEQQRKQQAHALEMQRKQQTAMQDAQIKTVQAQIAAQASASQAAAAVQAQGAQTVADLQISQAAAEGEQEIARRESEAKLALAKQEADTKLELKKKESEAAVEMKKAEAAAARKAKPKPAKSGAN